MQLVAVLLLLVLMSACGALPVPAQPISPPVASTAGAGPVRLWQDAAIFDAVRELAGAARQRLLVEMYEFGRRDLALLLRAAAERGVDVRLVYDPSVAQTVATVAALHAAGLPVRAYPLDDRRHQIDHVKLVVADGTALVGGMNWGTGSAANHDYALETVAAEAVARLKAIFEQDWAIAGGHPGPPAAASSDDVVQTSPGGEIRARLLALAGSARQVIDAELFVLTDHDVLAALAAARRRGVRVRVLLDPGQDVNRPVTAQLARAGVEVRFYPVPKGAKLHAKAGLFDGDLLLGSANWSASGLNVNHELDMHTDQPAVVAAFRARFDQDWTKAGGVFVANAPGAMNATNTRSVQLR